MPAKKSSKKHIVHSSSSSSDDECSRNQNNRGKKSTAKSQSNDDELNNEGNRNTSSSARVPPHILIENRKMISCVPSFGPKIAQPARANIKIATWNLLTQSSIELACGSYCPAFALAWKHRFALIKKQILVLSPDILCLQEVPNGNGELEEITKWLTTPSILFVKNEDGNNNNRPSCYCVVSATNFRQAKRKDAVLIAWRREKFELVVSDDATSSLNTARIDEKSVRAEQVSDNKKGKARDGVLILPQIPLPSPMSCPSTANAAIAVELSLIPESSTGAILAEESEVGCNNNMKNEPLAKKSFIVATTHLSGAKLAEETRQMEMKSLLESISKKFSHLPIVIAADLNSHPKWLLCQELVGNAKNVSGEKSGDENNNNNNFHDAYNQTKENSYVDKEFTCYMAHYQDVCDYILYRAGTSILRPVKLLQIPSMLDIVRQRVAEAEVYGNDFKSLLTFPAFEGLPTISFPSDHLPLMVEFEII